MKLCAVVCEYNPFHNGHLYQLNKAKAELGCEGIVCVMSGNFVQRAEPALINKNLRAETAVKNGADVVVELPCFYAVGSGDKFAYGAIELIKNICGMEYLFMGCETDNTTLLQNLAEIQCDESDSFKLDFKKFISSGLSYPTALAKATAEEAARKYAAPAAMSLKILSLPNNLLCIEYLKAIKKSGSNIKPYFIKREGDAYHCDTVSGGFASASALRNLISQNSLSNLEKYMPLPNLDKIIRECASHAVNEKTLSDLMIFNLRKHSPESLSKFNDVSEGLEYRIMKAAVTTNDYNELLDAVKTKRYTLSRLKRICLHALLDINTGIMSDITTVFGRILAIKRNIKGVLQFFPKNIYVQYKDVEDAVGAKQSYEIDKRASSLYALLTRNNEYLNYCNKPIIV